MIDEGWGSLGLVGVELPALFLVFFYYFAYVFVVSYLDAFPFFHFFLAHLFDN